MLLLHHNTLRRILRFLFTTLCRVEMAGMENIPREGGVLGATNHLSRLDGPLVYALMPRDDVSALVAKKYQRNPFFRWVLDSVRVIWLDRGNPDPRALKHAIQFLQGGGILGIAPEGTRSQSGAMIPAKPGVAYLATRAEVPILPVALTGTETAMRKLLWLRRPRVRVEFGPVFRLPPLDRKNRDESLQRNADEIMCRIAMLLPERYRGVYAQHPRLMQILEESAGGY